MARSTNPRRFLSEAETAAVGAAIKDAEQRTSSEVKVVLARHCWNHNTVYDNLITVATEILLVKGRTGQLPRALPPGVPKDLYTGRDFGYKRTEKGYTLGFDPDNLSRIRVRQFEFRVPK